MLSGIAVKITQKLIEKKAADASDAEVYEYGFEMLVANILSFSTAIAIGLITNQLINCLLFQLVFRTLRSYSGGYHARKESSCWILSTLMLVSSMQLLKVIPTLIRCDAGIVVIIISIILIVWLSPIDHPNKSLDEDDKIYYKKRTRINVLLLFFLEILTWKMKMMNFYWAIALALLITAISVVAGKKINFIKVQFS